jgi:hypothetical protein
MYLPDTDVVSVLDLRRHVHAPRSVQLAGEKRFKPVPVGVDDRRDGHAGILKLRHNDELPSLVGGQS